MRPLRVVQAAAFPFPSPQGSQVYVRGMARALARRGHDILVVCYAHGQGEPDEEYRVIRTPRVPGYQSMRAGPDLVKPWLDLALAARLSSLDADLIHAHNYEAPLAAYVARALRGTPVVYNNHNTMGEELHRYFQSRPMRKAAHALGRALDRSVPRRADACVAISQSAVGVLEQFGCRRIHHIPPGVEPEDLEGVDREGTRHRFGLGDRVWVVYAGNPDPYQDLEDLVDAVLGIPEVGLLMVSASSLKQWEDRAASLPPERKRFVVTAHWPEVRNLVAAADIAALPRRVCSGYPIKLLNTLGLGLPTVCAEGSAQPIEGVLRVPNGKPEALGEALLELARDPRRRKELGRRARRDVLSNHTWAARAVELEAMYRELLGYGARPDRRAPEHS